MTGSRSLTAAMATVLVAGIGLFGAAPALADRTVGGGPLDAVLEAADDYHDACPNPANRLTPNELAALVLAPSFPETGAPSNQAPAPMTLSRWDDQSALYSFNDRTTYTDAFWHPGIGAWAWDDASLQGLGAAQRIDSTFIAEFTTAFIANRWCSSPSFSTVWGPWHACGGGRCMTIYEELLSGADALDGVLRDDAVSRRGGMAAHDCTLGDGEVFRCWYVDADRAQGYRGFAIGAFGPSPVSAPFLGFRSTTHELRTWLREDTGYDTDVTASLELGRNSRGGLNWSTSSSLCDLTRLAGRCDPRPPPGMELELETISGDYEPLSGDFDGDGNDDILWYGAGSARDSLWMGRPSGPAIRSVNVSGVYDPLVGDFDGDGRDDIFWYGPGSGRDSRWYGTADGFDVEDINVTGTYRPIVGDFDADGFDDIFWYGPGSDKDTLWPGKSDRSFARRVNVTVRGTYVPLPGDFDGDGHGDVFWYGPGAGQDRVWYGDVRGSFGSLVTSVNGTYEPATGDLDGDGHTDVVWYRPGPSSDSVWQGRASGFAVQLPRPVVDGEYRIFTGDFDGGGNDEVFLHRPGPDYDARWR